MNLKTFFDNFEFLADAPDGVQKLREMILQLAIQGKLVPQDPKDEPASVLLEKIKSEKEKLIKGKIIKKSKPLPQIEKENIPYNLPSSWQWQWLEQIFYPVSSSNKKIKTKDVLSEGKYPVVDQGKKYIRGYSNNKNKLIKIPGTVIIFGDHTREIKLIDFDFIAGADGVKILRPIFINEKYFFHVLRNLDIESRGYSRHYKMLLNNLFPVPPLEEQKRIVAKVDQLMALCDELEERKQKRDESRIQLNDAALDRLLTAHKSNEFNKHWKLISNNFEVLYDDPENVNKLRQAILQLAVQGKLVPQDKADLPASVLLEKIKAEKERLIKEKKFQKPKSLPLIQVNNIPFQSPPNWEWEKAINLFFVTKLAGFEYTQYISLQDSGEIPAIRAQNIRMNYIDESNIKYIDRKTSELLDRCALDRPAILMTFIGAGIGDVAIFNKPERWHLAPNVAKLVPFNYYSYNLDIRYLQYYLMSDTGRNEIFKHKKATAQPSLSMTTIRDILIAIPPLKEQERIVTKIDQLMILCDELEKKLVQSKDDSDKLIEASIQQLIAA